MRICAWYQDIQTQTSNTNWNGTLMPYTAAGVESGYPLFLTCSRPPAAGALELRAGDNQRPHVPPSFFSRVTLDMDRCPWSCQAILPAQGFAGGDVLALALQVLKANPLVLFLNLVTR